MTSTQTSAAAIPPSDFMSELSAFAGRARAMRVADQFTIQTGSIDNFAAAIERRVGRLGEMPKSDSPMVSAQFGGLPVIENDFIPKNRAIIMRGNEIMQIVNLD